MRLAAHRADNGTQDVNKHQLRLWIMLPVTVALGSMLLGMASAPAEHAIRQATLAPASARFGAAVLDLVILVDESGSETDASVAAERRSAETIALSMLNPESRVTIVGFGGVNNVVPHQDPVNVACKPTIAASKASLSYLAECVTNLHRRSEAQGDDTDYAAALAQAMSYFDPHTAYGRQSPAGAIKVILMMTDGGVDVHRDTQQYSPDWLAGEHHAVTLQLAVARADDVHLWPLGFGPLITPQDAAYLSYLAENGAQAGCDNRAVSRPHAFTVRDVGDALTTVDTLFAQAACLGSSRSETAALNPTAIMSLSVDIPRLASSAAITVNHGDPRIQVTFYQPDGKRWTDNSAINGASTPVEVLHVHDPQPGQWRIEITAPPGLASRLSSATVFWQGAVNTELTVIPTIVRPGKKIAVTLSVLGADGPITDPATLAQLQVAINVSGDGLPEPFAIPVTSTGTTQGAVSGAGDYKAFFVAPRGQGMLTFSGTVQGYGLHTLVNPTSVQVSDTAPLLSSTIQFSNATSIWRGRTLAGAITFANHTASARDVRLTFHTSHVLAQLVSPSGDVKIRPGTSIVPFTITLARNSPLGLAWIQLKALDAADPAIVYSAGTLEITVVNPPSFLPRYRWEVLGLLIIMLLIVAAGFAWRLRRRQALDVRGLRVIIRRDGEQVGSTLAPPGKRADTLRFTIRDEGEPTERLAHPTRDDLVYRVRRGNTGYVDVITPTGERLRVDVNGTGRLLPNGLEVAFLDIPYLSMNPRSFSSNPNPRRASARRSTQPPQDDAPAPHDPWL